MSTRGRLRITQTMIEDFILDPVLASKWILNLDLDAFQRARLKLNWWVPNVIDDSGISSGKTIGIAAYAILRAVLLANYTKGHDVGFYSQVFQTSKDVFFREVEGLMSNAPLLRNEIGEIKKDPSCWTIHFRSGGRIDIPSPDVKNEAEGQAGRRFNTLIVDEWTKWDAKSNGINAELLGRNSRASYNKQHPIWANHYKFIAHAELDTHPSDRRYKQFLARVKKGDPRYAIQRWSFKDWSGLKDSSGRSFRTLYRDEQTIETERMANSSAEFVAKAGGIRMQSGVGWYIKVMLDAMAALGEARDVRPMSGRGRNMTGDYATPGMAADDE